MSYRVSLFTLLVTFSITVSLPLWSQSMPGPDDLANMRPGMPGNPSAMPGGPDRSMDRGAAMSRMDYCTITGTVSTSDHRPVANARVEVRNEETGAMIASGYTGPSGSFRVTDVPRGSYQVVASLGVSEAREDVEAMGINDSVNLVIPNTGSTAASGQDTVSVADLQVPEKAKKELHKAQDALKKGRTPEALKHIGKALTIDPQYANAFVMRGIVHMDGSNLNAALDDFQQALRCDPNAVMAYVGTGAIFNMQGQFDKALQELDRGAALQPLSWQAQVEIAKANLGMGNFQAALKHANRAQELSADQFYPIHLIKGHALLGLRAYAPAIKELQAFLAKDRSGQYAAAVQQEIQEAQAFVTTASAAR